MTTARAAIVLAAGQGVRMRSSTPKVLHKVGGRAMADWTIAAAQALGCSPIVVVAGAHTPEVAAHAAAALGPKAVAIQDPPLGTAHAVLAAAPALRDFQGDAVVLYADTPLVRPQTLEAMFEARAGADIVVLGFEAAAPTGYGRLILESGALARIVEEKDASAQERAVTLCNSGMLVGDAQTLLALLAKVGCDNAKGEYYLTDVIALARAAGLRAGVVMGAEAEMLGVNARAQLAQAEAAFQARARAAALEAGVTLIDPSTVYFSHDTALAPDVTVEPHVVFGPGVRVAEGARIRAFSHLEGAEVGAHASVGPFARLRPGARLGAKVKIGNFVEVKNATFGEAAQASHLAYVGDAEIGARANIAAGVITCNYDGFHKHRTVIGPEAFIGSDTALVAPVRVGARAYTASGSVITEDVPDGALALARSRQSVKPGWSERFRAAREARAVKDKP